MTTPDDNTIVSPRLRTLVRDLETGYDAALDAFWAEIAAHGAPIIDSIPDDAMHRHVTFLWRTGTPVENVALITNLASSMGTTSDLCAGTIGSGAEPMATDPMHRVPQTDLWYVTYRLPIDVRTRYSFRVDDMPRPDPFNRHAIRILMREDGDEASATTFSTLELPDAPPQPWSAPQLGIPTGHVERYTIPSAILANERPVWVYTPPGYTTDSAPYGLLILFDGWGMIQCPPTPMILDNLCNAGHLPPLVTVMLSSLDQETRTRELRCYPPHLDCLMTELLPWVHRHYHVTTDPTRTTIGGLSLGGLAAAYAGLERSDVFGNVLSLSGSFYWKPDEDREYEWIARQFATRPMLSLRFFLSVGTYETFFRGASAPSLLVANRHLRDVLAAKGYPVIYQEYAGGHDFACWSGEMADGLQALIKP